jgi:hypothetical protein
MSVKFVLDENIGSHLKRAIQQYNEVAATQIEFTFVGAPPDLPKTTTDRELLLWAERMGYVVVSHDKRTLPTHLAAHLSAGRHLPGLFLITEANSVWDIVELLAVAAISDPDEFRDRIEYLS